MTMIDVSQLNILPKVVQAKIYLYSESFVSEVVFHRNPYQIEFPFSRILTEHTLHPDRIPFATFE